MHFLIYCLSSFCDCTNIAVLITLCKYTCIKNNKKNHKIKCSHGLVHLWNSPYVCNTLPSNYFINVSMNTKTKYHQSKRTELSPFLPFSMQRCKKYECNVWLPLCVNLCIHDQLFRSALRSTQSIIKVNQHQGSLFFGL